MPLYEYLCQDCSTKFEACSASRSTSNPRARSAAGAILMKATLPPRSVNVQTRQRRPASGDAAGLQRWLFHPWAIIGWSPSVALGPIHTVSL